MRDLKKTLDAGGHCVLEMPSGTGKTVSLLSLIVAYQQHYDADRKLVYCSRTVPEIEKALAELKRLMAYRADQGYAAKDSGYIGLGLSSRKNLCLHPSISQERRGKAVDARCRDLTSAHAVQKGRSDPGSHELCSYHEGLSEVAPGEIVPPGIWTIEDVKKFGQQKGYCPYFSVRRMVGVVVFTIILVKSYQRYLSVIQLSTHFTIFSIQKSLKWFQGRCLKMLSSFLMKHITLVGNDI